MEDENVRQRSEEFEAEARTDPWFWSPGDEELDPRGLLDQPPHDGQDCGLRLVIRALVQGVDHDDCGNIRRSERLDYQLPHLAVERLVYDIWIRLEEGNEDGSEFMVLVCQLEGEGREDEVEIAPVLEIARTEEGGSQQPVGEDPFADRLGDRGLASPSQPVQPEDRRLIEVFGPRLDFAQNAFSGPFEATAAAAVAVLCSLCTTALV